MGPAVEETEPSGGGMSSWGTGSRLFAISVEMCLMFVWSS